MEIKYRRRDLLAAMMRIDPVLRSLEAQRATGEGLDAAIRARQQLLMPMYHSMALQFAEMHETPVRLPLLPLVLSRPARAHSEIGLSEPDRRPISGHN